MFGTRMEFYTYPVPETLRRCDLKLIYYYYYI
jgi:hypothetical protein